MSGFKNTSPTNYKGTKVGLVPSFVVNRVPTSTDIFNPQTGKYYSVPSFWVIGKNPTSGTEGDVWVLTKISNTAFWVLTSLVGGAINSLQVNTISGTGVNPVVPTAGGLVTLIGADGITTNSSVPNQVEVTLTTPVTVDHGGTGRVSLTDGAVLVGNNTLGITQVGPGLTTGTPLVNTAGGDPSYSTVCRIREVGAGNGVLIQASVDAGGLSFANSNTSTVVGAGSRNTITVDANGTGSDAYTLVAAGVGSGSSWEYGARGSDKTFQIQSAPANGGIAMDGTTVWQSTQAGIITTPLQPTFFAHLGASVVNATGMGATYTLGVGTALTIDALQGSGLATNGTFTAPATGWYNFSICIQVTNISVAMTSGIAWIRFDPGAVFFPLMFLNPAAVVSVGGSAGMTFIGTVTIPMSATNTAIAQLQISNGAGDTATIVGGAQTTLNYSWIAIKKAL